MAKTYYLFIHRERSRKKDPSVTINHQSGSPHPGMVLQFPISLGIQSTRIVAGTSQKYHSRLRSSWSCLKQMITSLVQRYLFPRRRLLLWYENMHLHPLKSSALPVFCIFITKGQLLGPCECNPLLSKTLLASVWSDTAYFPRSRKKNC